MRPERNPLDLNNLPDDYYTKQVFDDTSSSGGGYRKKKSGGKDGKEESGKVYECRFCSLKFCKSQALGGHMNRHRQERETETLNRARQLVFSSENLAAPPPHPHPHPHPHLGCHPAAGSYHQLSNYGDPYHHRSVYPAAATTAARLFSAGSSSSSSTQQQPFLYTSPSRVPPAINDYYIGHVLNNNYAGGDHHSSNYTCIGAPVGGGADGTTSLSINQQEEGLNWGRSYGGGAAAGSHSQPPNSSSFNRFQDGF